MDQKNFVKYGECKRERERERESERKSSQGVIALTVLEVLGKADASVADILVEGLQVDVVVGKQFSDRDLVQHFGNLSQVLSLHGAHNSLNDIESFGRTSIER